MLLADVLLDVQDLRTEYVSGDGVTTAVDAVSFQVRAGETLGLIGESGSGKSTIGYSLLRLLPRERGRITGGHVTFRGIDLLSLGERQMRRLRGKEIAMIFQQSMSALNPVYTIGQQIAEAVRAHDGATRKSARRRAREMLETVGMPDAERRLDAYPHQLSGGLRQRAMIAVALACRPKLLIADEPTTALDVTVQAQILDLLKDIQRDTGMAILLITHDLGVVAEVADRALVLYAGRLVEEAPTRQLLSQPHMPYTKGLLQSLPQGASGGRLKTIPGQVPTLSARPHGCAFHPRCDEARQVCVEGVVGMSEVAAGHWVRCRRWRELPAGEPMWELAG